MRAPGWTCVVMLATVATSAETAHAFDSKGHDVIEALVYRSLIEGHDSEPARPEVLRDLINDGALRRPICFGNVKGLPEDCTRAATENPLLAWPQPLTDRPDANFRRQFSDAGQCFHFMGTADDERSAPLPKGHIPRDLATRAILRCRSLLDDLLRQIVLVGGTATRESGYGLYELMHAVGDSFSTAHAERQPGTHAIDFLRVWEPAAKLAGSRVGAYYSLSPTRHDADEPRDRAYVRNFAEVGGRPCRDLTGVPYAVPFACLSDEGELARQSLVELLVVTRELRVARLASSGSPASASPETSEAWTQLKTKWFSPVEPCRGEECTTRQPAERVVSSDILAGLGSRYDPGRSRFSVTASALWLRWSQELNPFIYGLGAAAGYRRSAGTDQAIAELGLVTALPVGSRASVGVTPIALRAAFGSDRGPELVTQLARVDFVPASGTWLSLLGPAEVDWLRVRVDWSVGLAVGVVPSFGSIGGGALLDTPSEEGGRHDESWSPEPLWYGRLKGRRASIFAIGDATPIPKATSSSAVGSPEEVLGMAGLGASISWGRDPWNSPLRTSYGAALDLGVRRTTLDNRYFVIALAAEGRWYFLPPLGLSLVPVRFEAGPRITGERSAETSPNVSGSFFVQAGTRLGLAFSAGIVDFLVQAPTLVWRDAPFDDGEILTLRVGIRVR